MTFDDGILKIYRAEDVSEPGGKPDLILSMKSYHYFSYDTIGITRYYAALQANQQISAVVNIPDWHDIGVNDICILEDGKQYKILMCQPTMDDDGLKIMKLSLERLGEEYVIKT